ncbi:MAG: NAD-dependent epimerase/dehydratase family protein [Xanthomonadales bacterium]|nr:NAD(P)-dependent oxidoreductase [Xanthomonadales bacterium]NIX13232.1 NAD-dependent epimerase/dehydratase family protein [Xanthomonadales bacterium]
MKILVTGSSGRIGRAIWVRLAPGHEVVGLDRSVSSTVQFVGDIADPKLLKDALQGVDAVVHTAALHAPHVGLAPDAEFGRINVAATRQLAGMAADAGIRHFVFTSTTALYGNAATPDNLAGWVDEDLEPRPRTIYHATKVQAEDLLADMANQTGMAVTAIRMSRCFPEPAPTMAAYRLHRGVDARDVADAHALALDRPQPGFRKFVISGATPFREEDTKALFDDAPSLIGERTPGLAEAFKQRGWPLPASIDRIYSPAKAMRELGWKPRFGFAEVLKMLDEQSSEVLPPGSLPVSPSD